MANSIVLMDIHYIIIKLAQVRKLIIVFNVIPLYFQAYMYMF